MIACAIGAIQSRNRLLRRVTFRVFGTMLALAGLIYMVRKFWW
jgi:hypothetical protein